MAVGGADAFVLRPEADMGGAGSGLGRFAPRDGPVSRRGEEGEAGRGASLPMTTADGRGAEGAHVAICRAPQPLTAAGR